MGSFLDKPNTEKEFEDVNDNGLRAGAAAMQGWRVTMEDSHTMIPSIEDLPDHGFFAVYDGHGGDQVAKIAGVSMIDKLVSMPEWQEYKGRDDKMTDAAAVQLGQAMRAAFLSLDDDMSKRPAAQSGEDASGCTAVAGVITPHFTVVANAGDSRSILGKNNSVVAMSFDHKPFNPTEQERIEKAGGCVSMKRVNGDLAVSRALGDYSYKQSAELPAEAQQVSAEPDIEIQRRDGTEEFLLIACDGIWDMLSNEEACTYVRQNMKNLETPDTPLSRVAGDLVDTCLVKGSRDNMSAVVIAYTGNGAPKIGTEPKKWEKILQEEDPEG